MSAELKRNSGRPKSFDTEKVLQKARDIFWEKGYHATSTEDLMQAMNIGRGSFYLAFPDGKRDVFRRTVEMHHHNAYVQLEKSLRGSSKPLQVLKDFFLAIASGAGGAHQKGCYSGNTIVEMSQIDPEMEQVAASGLKDLEALFARALASARAAGSLPGDADPALLARHLVTLWNGLNITRRMYPSHQKLQALIEMQLKILG